jgi:hypothetical protein
MDRGFPSQPRICNQKAIVNAAYSGSRAAGTGWREDVRPSQSGLSCQDFYMAGLVLLYLLRVTIVTIMLMEVVVVAGLSLWW